MKKKQARYQEEFDKKVQEENQNILDAKTKTPQKSLIKKDQEKSVRYSENKKGLDYQTKQSPKKNNKSLNGTESAEPIKTIEKFSNVQGKLSTVIKFENIPLDPQGDDLWNKINSDLQDSSHVEKEKKFDPM